MTCPSLENGLSSSLSAILNGPAMQAPNQSTQGVIPVADGPVASIISNTDGSGFAPAGWGCFVGRCDRCSPAGLLPKWPMTTCSPAAGTPTTALRCKLTTA